MTRRRRGAESAPCTVTVCRGCCCGNPTLNPGFDHPGQLATLRSQLAGQAVVRVSDCLDMCAQANVVVVSPSVAGRSAGARPVWLGLITDPGATDDLVTWVRAGGPGVADPPATLDLYVVNPPRRIRQSFER